MLSVAYSGRQPNDFVRVRFRERKMHLVRGKNRKSVSGSRAVSGIAGLALFVLAGCIPLSQRSAVMVQRLHPLASWAETGR
jgi:hypothetical protein